MYFKRFFVEGLAHASYLLGAKGEAAVVDPKRDVDDYLAAAEREGLRIVAIFNSHPHAAQAEIVFVVRQRELRFAPSFRACVQIHQTVRWL
jgi:hypothetical protein